MAVLFGTYSAVDFILLDTNFVAWHQSGRMLQFTWEVAVVIGQVVSSVKLWNNLPDVLTIDVYPNLGLHGICSKELKEVSLSNFWLQVSIITFSLAETGTIF